MSQPLNTQNTTHIIDDHPYQYQNEQPMIHPSSLPTYSCHKCSSLIAIHPSQIESIKKQQQDTKHKHKQQQQKQNKNIQTNHTKEPVISLQCVYVKCSIRSNNLFECADCSQLSLCRNCTMPLCKACCSDLKVLSCRYCDSFICSQQCYTALLKKYFVCLENFGLSVRSHESMHFFRKLLLAPHLHAAIGNITDDNLPFHVCESCKVQNCGCVDWLSCVNCRKYYCVDCEDKALQKCTLEDCQSRTCCRQKQWNEACEYCNRLGHCKLIFCSKGHCNRHLIINREVEYNEMEKTEQKEQALQDTEDEQKVDKNNDE